MMTDDQWKKEAIRLGGEISHMADSIHMLAKHGESVEAGELLTGAVLWAVVWSYLL